MYLDTVVNIVDIKAVLATNQAPIRNLLKNFLFLRRANIREARATNSKPDKEKIW